MTTKPNRQSDAELLQALLTNGQNPGKTAQEGAGNEKPSQSPSTNGQSSVAQAHEEDGNGTENDVKDRLQLLRFIKELVDFKEHLLVFSLALYIIGFIINNLYLGSLGVSNFEVLRVRYIMVGLLFTIISGFTIFSMHEVKQIIIYNKDKGILNVIRKVLNFSMNVHLFVIFGVIALVFLSGSTGITPMGVSQVSSFSWSEWIYNNREELMETVFVFFISILLLITVGLVALVLYDNRKLFKRPSKKYILFCILKPKNLIFFVLTCVNIISLSVLIGFLVGFVVFLLENHPNTILFSQRVQENSTLAWLFVMSIYDFTLLLLLFTYLTARTLKWRGLLGSKLDDKSENDTKRNSMIQFIEDFSVYTPLVLLFIAYYVYFVYPSIPQQVGGGKEVKVEVVTSNEKLEEIFLDPEIELYLVDRTTDSVILMVINQKEESRAVMDVPKSEVESIIYNPSP